MEQTAISLLDRLPPWLQIALALVVILIVLSPVLVTYIARTVVEWKKFKARLDKAQEEGVVEVVKLVWAEGQHIKEQLDAAGMGRGDFFPRLRQVARSALIDHGLPVELADVVLNRARLFHKKTKTQRPKLVPGAVMELVGDGDGEDPPVSAGGSTPAPSSQGSGTTVPSASRSELQPLPGPQV